MYYAAKITKLQKRLISGGRVTFVKNLFYFLVMSYSQSYCSHTAFCDILVFLLQTISGYRSLLEPKQCKSFAPHVLINLHRPKLLTTQSRPCGSYRIHTFQTCLSLSRPGGSHRTHTFYIVKVTRTQKHYRLLPSSIILLQSSIKLLGEESLKCH